MNLAARLAEQVELSVMSDVVQCHTQLCDLVQCFFAQQCESWQPRDPACLPHCLSNLLEQSLSNLWAGASLCEQEQSAATFAGVKQEITPESRAVFTWKLLEKLNYLTTAPSTATLPVALPAHNQAWANSDMFQLWKSNLELMPLTWCLYFSLVHPADWNAVDDRQHLAAADFQLARLHLLLCALVTAKLGSCLAFTNSKSGMDTLAWKCLEAAHIRFTRLLRSCASKQPRPDDATKKEDEVLCVLLIKELLPTMRQSARAYNQMQYRGQAAVNIALSVIHCGAASYPVIADAILKSGKCS